MIHFHARKPTLYRRNMLSYLYTPVLCTPDFCILFVIYKIIESDVENVMELDCEMSTVHSYLSKLPNGLILEETEYIISKAYSTYLVYPPNILQRTAKYIVSQRLARASCFLYAIFLISYLQNFILKRYLIGGNQD